MKVYNYTILMVGIILLLEFAGIPTGAAGFLAVFGLGTSTFSFTTSSFFTSILGSAGILIGITAGIIIGTLTRSSPENYVILPLITGVLGAFVQSFYLIVNYAISNFSAWIYAPVMMIFAPLTIGYVLSLVEFFRGTD